MDLKIDDFTKIHSPCRKCSMNGNVYSPDNETCRTCEYSVAIQFLSKIMFNEYRCSVCKKREKSTELDCSPIICNGNESDFVIDWIAFINQIFACPI